MQTRVLFYVQHLLGIGHLVRANRLAAALGRGFEVLLVVGGELPPGLEFESASLFQLPPVKAGPGGFGTLVHPNGAPFDAEDKAERRDMLVATFDEFLPDIVLIEAFPFGRRQMRFELLPLLDRAAAAAHRPLIACSVRDILQDARPERRAETLALIRRYFGVVLVHGDPRLAHLGDTFPDAEAIAPLVHYTGLVGPASEPPDPRPDADEAEETFDVIVSVGGGAVGARLVAAALAARPLTALADARWLVLTGPNGRDEALSDDPDVVVRRFVPDLPARLACARVSVSQAGYNTVTDVLAARCRAVLVPFAEGGETEQTRRAVLMAGRRLAVHLPEADLDPAALALAIDDALTLPEPDMVPALDGAAVACEVLARHLGLR